MEAVSFIGLRSLKTRIPFPNRHGIDKEIELVNQVVLNQRRDERCPAIDDNVLSWRALEPVYGFRRVAVFQADILPIDMVGPADGRHTAPGAAAIGATTAIVRQDGLLDGV